MYKKQADIIIKTARCGLTELGLACIMSFIILPVRARQVMRLPELYALADDNSKTIKIFESAITVSPKSVQVAKNAYLPDINFSASATYNGNAWIADRNFTDGKSYSSPHFGNSFAIEASQTIFAGGSIYHNVKAKELQRQISEWDLQAHRQEIYFLLTGYYLDLYKYRNLLTVYDRNIEQTKQVIQDMRGPRESRNST